MPIPKFKAWNQVPEKTPLEGVSMRTVWGEKAMMALFNIDPEAEVPLHHHPHEQLGMVLEGSITFVVNGEEVELTKGTTYVIPGGVAHSARAGENGAVVLDIFSPPREEYKD